MSTFSPEQLQQIRELLQSGALAQHGIGPDGRTPVKPRQLSDLRLLPTAKDARPLFLPSVEAPREWDTTKTFPYPKLLWGMDGTEITVYGSGEEAQKLAEGYSAACPMQRAESTQDRFERELAALSPEDQQLVLEAIKSDRLRKVQEMAHDLTSAQLEASTGQPVKRGPGRPKKIVNE